VWAALLIPNFVTSRREAPIHSTENFARSTARLAAVRAISAETSANRNRIKARRRHILIGLGVVAVATLVAAIITASWTILIINLIVDAVLSAYVAMLLQVKEYSQARQLELAGRPLEGSEQAEVQVING
jgi:hypothetical protein